MDNDDFDNDLYEDICHVIIEDLGFNDVKISCPHCFASIVGLFDDESFYEIAELEDEISEYEKIWRCQYCDNLFLHSVNED